jgi:CheY-like chemotaxis protein
MENRVQAHWYETPSSSRQNKQRPILVVDDDPLTLHVLESVLRHANYAVVSTAEPIEALRLVREHRPALVVLDLNMPEMDGLTLLERIRDNMAVPCIMVTGTDRSEYAVRAIRMGAYDYLTKPVEFRKLLDIVAVAIGTESDPTDARRLSHYELRREIGRGGMGVVYEARDRTLDRLVAVKVLLPKLAIDPHFELRFLGEAKAAARLSHPGIVTVYEAGRSSGRLFIAMELVHGTTLHCMQDWGRRFTSVESLGVILQAAEALQSAHEAGLVHRDVKPSNLMLTPSFDVKVLDFGLVRPLRPLRDPITDVGVPVGTPGYASPESIRGGPVDARSDIYSLGVLWHEMLAHERAFDAPNTYALLMNITEGRVRRRTRDIPEVSLELAELIESMMAVDPSARPATMRDVIQRAREIRGRW